MKKIFKYRFSIDSLQELTIPSGYQILSVQVQNGFPCIWALVEESNPSETLRIKTFGTGEIIPNADDLIYIGNIQFDKINFVGHVFIQK